MKIWILTTEYPPQGGGIGTYVFNAARMFATGGHDVTVLKSGVDSHVIDTDEGVRLIEFATDDRQRQTVVSPDSEPDDHPAFPYNVMSYWPALSFQFASEFKHWTNKFGRPDIVETQDYGGIGYYFIIKRLLHEPPFSMVPIILHLHSPVFELQKVNRLPRYKLPQYWVGQMEKFCIRAADSAVSPSNYLVERVRAQVDGMAPVTIIPHPYQCGSNAQSSLTRNDVVYFGRVDYLKGALHLLDSCAKLWTAGQEFSITLIGGDSEPMASGETAKQHLRRKYQKFITAGNLIICESLPTDKLLARVARAWCVVIPSLFENFPNTCIEAMSLGKLVLASTSGGQAELIGLDEQAGILFDWNAVGDFEAKLGQVLSMPASKVESFGHKAAQRVDRLTDYTRVLSHTIAHFQAVRERSQISRTHYPAPNPSILAPDNDDSESGLLSVIVPYYNMGWYVAETLDSIFTSTYSPCEIIIINDGSTDAHSLRVLAEIEAQTYSQVRVISIENGGVANARNLGATRARGEYLAFVDADDKVEPEFFAKAIAVLEQYKNVSFVYSWLRYFGEARGCWITYNAEFPFLLGHNMVPVLAVFRRQHYIKYGQHRSQLVYDFEDYDSWISMVAAGCVGISLPELLANYRIRSNSRHQSANLDAHLHMYDIISHHHDGVYRRHAIDLVNLLVANGTSLVWSHPGADWKSPLTQLQEFKLRYQVELGSQDFVTRHFIRLTLSNLKKSIIHPVQAWKKFLKWYSVYFNKNQA